MAVSQARLRQIIREELTRVDEQSVPAAFAKQAYDYLAEPAARSLTAAQKGVYALSRGALDATQTGAAAMATGKAGPTPQTFKWDGPIPTIAQPAVAAQMSDLPNFVDNPIWQIVSLLDPTSFMSWPGFMKSWATYSRNPSVVNGSLLLIAALSLVPVAGTVIKSTRVLTMSAKLSKSMPRITGAATMSQKLRVFLDMYTSAGGRMIDVVQELRSSEILELASKQISKSGTKATEEELYEILRTSANFIDKYGKTIKYIHFVISNAKEEVFTAAVQKMSGATTKLSPEIEDQVRKIADSAARAVPGVAPVPA